jgi:transcriptional regulator with XRE-family HTH domain
MDTSGNTTDPVARAIGDELRDRREANGWTLAQLAACLPPDVDDQTLLAYENGYETPPAPHFVTLCGKLGVSAPELLGHALDRVESSERGHSPN